MYTSTCVWCYKELVSRHPATKIHAECKRERQARDTSLRKQDRAYEQEIDRLLIKAVPRLAPWLGVE